MITYEEKLVKVSHDFSLLSEDQQDYILGILQALVFAKNSDDHSKSKNTEPVPDTTHTVNDGQDISVSGDR